MPALNQNQSCQFRQWVNRAGRFVKLTDRGGEQG